jgi:glutamine synthetase
MPLTDIRKINRYKAAHRELRHIVRPKDTQGNFLKVSDYFGSNVFDIKKAKEIPEKIRTELTNVSSSKKQLSPEHAKIVATAVVKWANHNGVTHFCHWFQPLTGGTAEKHDAFFSLKKGKAVELLSVSQLLQGEPDASSFPNGGARSTFEARGYTSWDLSSPIFITEGPNGKTLCIPTAFVSYTGEALDIKTPLLRSVTNLSKHVTKFLTLTGHEDVTEVDVNVGCEQEYFLIDKAFYFERPDLVMTGRTLLGSSTTRNQQLDDHYFGTIPDRIMGYMQELDLELYKLGIPAKTRHNEVAPGQFELAPIFCEANLAADQNQLMMATIKSVAIKHDLVAILHEKPFAGINGSGKHVNWSMGDNKGRNLLDPGETPHENSIFLAHTAIVIEAVRRHSKMLRMSIASQGNDHRLGANEAPPSIISIFLGETLDKIMTQLKAGKKLTDPNIGEALDLGASQLVRLEKDNTDRNRTSPFAFTGNRFEFRAVGSSAAVGFPISILNTAVADVYRESCEILEKDLSKGMSIDEAILKLTKKWIDQSYHVVFNGDGYSTEWIKEAEKRGLANLRTTAEALKVLNNPEETKFLTENKTFSTEELSMRYHVLTERYVTLRKIEFNTLIALVNQHVLPAAVAYKSQLSQVIGVQNQANLESSTEIEIYKKLDFAMASLYANTNNLSSTLKNIEGSDQEVADQIANNLMAQSEIIAEYSNEIERIIPNACWSLPTYFDMMFIK